MVRWTDRTLGLAPRFFFSSCTSDPSLRTDLRPTAGAHGLTDFPATLLTAYAPTHGHHDCSTR